MALQPLLLNDRLLFIRLEKERECSPKNPNPVLSGHDGSRPSLLQIAVYSRCFVWLWCLTANESIFLHLEQVGCGSTSSQNWTEHSAHLPLLSLWLSDHLFAVICPFSHDAETEAISEAPTEFHQCDAESCERGNEIEEDVSSCLQRCCIGPQHP